METRLTTDQGRIPAAPVYAFTLHPFKLFVRLETGLKSGYFIRPAAPQPLGALRARSIQHLFGSESKDGASFVPTFPSQTLCPENTTQGLLPGV